jgi:hypothetical protein
LTDVAIGVNDLRNREPLQQQVMAVLDRAPANVRGRSLAEAQRVHQLIEEPGDSVIDLRFDRNWKRSRRDLGPAARDDLFAVGGNEVIELTDCHGTSSSNRGFYGKG